MSAIQKYLKSFRQADDLEVGLFEKNDGTQWIRNPDGSETQIGSGGAQTAREVLNGNTITVADGQTGTLTWDNKVSGDDLLDLSDPEAPTIVTAGIYAITVQGEPDSSLSIGGCFVLHLNLNQAEGAFVSPTAPPSTAQNSAKYVNASLTYYMAAGDPIVVTVDNQDGSQSNDFLLGQAIIQRIS